MSVIAVGAGAAVLGTGLKAYQGFSQTHDANEMEKNLKDPIYNIPQEFYQNRNIAQQMAQNGLPSQQYNNQVNNINQNQSAGIAALSNSANPGANLAAITRAGNSATGNLNAEDAAAKDNNQRYFIQQNGALANQELAKQQNDVFDKYTRNFNQVQALRGAGQQNLMSSVNDLTGLGLAAATGGINWPKRKPTDAENMWGIGTMGAKHNAPMLDSVQGGLNAGMINNTDSINLGARQGYGGIGQATLSQHTPFGYAPWEDGE